MCSKATITASVTLTLLALQSTATAQLWLDPRCKALPLTNVTQLVQLRDGRLLTIEGAATKTSSDDGKTWSAPRKIYDGPAPGIPTHGLQRVAEDAGRHAAGGLHGRLHGKVGLGQREKRSYART